MIKYSEYIGTESSQVITVLELDSKDGGLTKIASKSPEYSEALKDYINNLTGKPGKTYLLSNAMGAGEYYGSNRNGDYFPVKALKEYHKTFEVLAKIYKHHQNKNPENSYGKVLFSNYNDKMHRVELILELDDAKAQDIVKEIKQGKLHALSMGSRVPYDICCICGNKAKSRNEYCDHLKKQLSKILPDGRKVYAINTQPKFFDISIVTIPADATAGVIKVFKNLPIEKNIEKSTKKLASFDDFNYNLLKTAACKKADITKHTDPEPVDISIAKNPKDLVNKIKDKKKIEKLAEYPLNEILSTFLGLRIFPDRADFQKLALYSLGKKKLADDLEEKNIVFELANPETNPIIPSDVSLNGFNEKIAELMTDELPEIVLTKEFITARNLIKTAQMQTQPLTPDGLIDTTVFPSQPPADRSFIKKVLFDYTPDPKLSPIKNPVVPLGILGGLYYGYAKLFNDPSTSGFRTFIGKNAWLLPLLVGGGVAGSLWLQDMQLNKTASSTVDRFFRNSLISVPAFYFMSSKAEADAKNGIPITPTQNFIRKHPILSSLIASIIGTKAENMIRSNITKVAEVMYKIPENKLNEIYNEL